MIDCQIRFNVYIVPMTIFPFDRDDIAARPGPRYRAIADALRDAVKSGKAPPGTRLPPLRDLAYELGVTVGTVSRAYALAASRGEVSGEVGRGTYVRGHGGHERGNTGVGSASFLTLPEATEVAMKAAYAPPAGQTEFMGAAMSTLIADLPTQPGASPFNNYILPGGGQAERAAAASWLALGPFAPQADEILVCSGVQQAILTAILCATEPGDVILTEALTYHAMVNQSGLMGRRVAPVDIDDEGLMPDALDRAARELKPAALFIVPTLQNPTSAIMSEFRRREIVAIAERHDFTIIEDDIYGMLVEDRPLPLAQFAPERTWYTTSLAKSAGCGLRVGFLVPPRALQERARAILHGQGQTVPPLMAELAARLIVSGDAATICGNIKSEMRERHALTGKMLAGHGIAAHPASLYVWLELPQEWRAHAFVEAARARGIAIAAGEDFMVGRMDRASRHVRLAIGQPQTREELIQGLDVVATLLSEKHIAMAVPA